MVLGNQTNIVSLTTGKAQLSCRDFKCIFYLKIEKKRIVYDRILCPKHSFKFMFAVPLVHVGLP